MSPRPANPAGPPPEDERPLPSPAGTDLVQFSREELRSLVHELRNGLNSVLMNAAVLAAACRDRPDMGRHIAQIESDGQRCAQCLQSLSERRL